MKFLIKTVEHVEGLYHVEADSAEEARREFENDPRHWGEQVHYGAFEIEVREVTEIR